MDLSWVTGSKPTQTQMLVCLHCIPMVIRGLIQVPQNIHLQGTMPSRRTILTLGTSTPNSWKVKAYLSFGNTTLTLLADPEWTKEETDYLFNLVREYDSRFYIVADRYEFATGPPRSMEVRYVRVSLSTRL